MPDKPTTAAGYPPGQLERVKSTCLYLATKLGDLMPELVVVGGLVPALLINQDNLADNVPPHVGTLDLDLGLAFALVGEQRYQAVAERLRLAKFRPDVNADFLSWAENALAHLGCLSGEFIDQPRTGFRVAEGALG